MAARYNNLAAVSPAGRAGHAIATAAAQPDALAVTQGLLLFAVTAWGASFVAARTILSAPPGQVSLTPTLLAAVRFLIASAFFGPVLLLRQVRRKGIEARDLPLFLLLGTLAVSLYFFLQYTGVRLTNAGVSAVIVVGGIPPATMAVSALMDRESLGLGKALAVACGAVGIAIVATQRGLSVALGGGFLLGALCLALDAVCFGFYSVLVRRMRARYSPVTITAATTLMGTLGLVAVSAVVDDWGTLRLLSAGQWGAVAYLAVVCSILAYLAYNRALVTFPAARAAVWIYLESPVAIVLGVVLLGEKVAAMTVVGALVIIGSLLAAERG
ncbi:MAG: EamA family transporter [Bacillota bacterium]|nr:EamA family transporter [Bacillota bacterium]